MDTVKVKVSLKDKAGEYGPKGKRYATKVPVQVPTTLDEAKEILGSRDCLDAIVAGLKLEAAKLARPKLLATVAKKAGKAIKSAEIDLIDLDSDDDDDA